MKFFTVLFLISILTFFSGASQAANFEVTPIIGYTFGGSLKDSDTEESLKFGDSESYGLILGLRDETKAGGGFYELLFLHQKNHVKIDDSIFPGGDHLDVDINYLHFGGRYGSEGEVVNPFVVAGVGATFFDPDEGGSITKFSFSIGGGANIPLSKHISLRLEGRGFGTIFDSNSAVFCEDHECRVRVKGDLLWQFTAFSGIVFNF